MRLGEMLYTQALRDPGATTVVCRATTSLVPTQTRVSRSNDRFWRRWVVVLLVWAGVFAAVLLGLIVCSAALTGLLVRHVQL